MSCEVLEWLRLWMWLLSMFLFKQKTAYEVRISDWSSDVCSSDLGESCDSSAAACPHGAVPGCACRIRDPPSAACRRSVRRWHGDAGRAGVLRARPMRRV